MSGRSAWHRATRKTQDLITGAAVAPAYQTSEEYSAFLEHEASASTT